jgi:hypothetical protein
MINYVFINNKFWQQGKLIGVYNNDQYLFEANGRNENVTSENLRVTTNRAEGTNATLHEIFPNIYIEVNVTNIKGNYATLSVPSGFYEYPTTKLTKMDKIQQIRYL